MLSGNKIKLIIVSKGLKVKYVASLSHIHPNYLSMIISGKCVPSLYVLQIVASVLDVSVSDFFVTNT